MNKNVKILVLILSLALTISAFFAVTATAAEENTPSLEIISKNLSYEDNIRILFAVKSANVGDAAVTLKVYETDPQDDPAAAVKETVAAAYSEEINDYGECDVFFTTGIAAKYLNSQIYVQAEVTVDGVTYKSAVARYSIVEYCHEMIAKETTDAAKDAKYMDVIEYGAAIQSFLVDDGKYSGALATDYKYVTIDGGTLDGRYDAGIYLAGTKLNPTIAGATKLVTDAGAVVDNAADYTVGATNVSFAKADAKALATIDFEGATTSNLPSAVTYGAALPNISRFNNNSYTNATHSIRSYDGNETNTLYFASEYNKTKAVVKVAESATAESGANTVEFEADLMLKWSTSMTNCEFFNMAIADANGNVAFNIVLRNTTADNIGIMLRNSTGGQVNDIGRTLKQNAQGAWFNLRVVYKYVNETTIGVEVFLDGTSIGTSTTPFDASNAMSIDEIANGYFVVNGVPSTSHAINSYVAIDNVVFRKIAE